MQQRISYPAGGITVPGCLCLPESHDSCPVLFFYGTIDTVVSVDNTIDLDAACKKYGIAHTYVLYPEVEQLFIWPGDKYNKQARADAWRKTILFLKTNLSVPR